MSDCVCQNRKCDARDIAAGLNELPRQIGTFPDFRAAMLAQIRANPSLDGWRPCGQEDLGLMLLEMWSYMLDVQSFYDQVLTHESLIRTADHRPSLRKLVALLGYVPRPAVAANATLALTASGRQAIGIPIGSGFRSGAFGDEAPQVFETSAAQSVHPLNNQWTILPPISTTVAAGGSATDSHFSFLLVESDTVLKVDDLVLLSISGAPDSYRQVRTVVDLTDYETINGDTFKRVTFDAAITLRGDFEWRNLKLYRSTQVGSLWTKNSISGDSAAIDGSRIVLDALYRRLIVAGDFVVLSRLTEHRWFQVQSVGDVNMTIAAAGSAALKDLNDVVTSTIDVPAVKAPITRVTMTQAVEQSNWNSANANKMSLHYGFELAAQVVTEPASELDSDAALRLDTGRNSELEGPVDAGTPQRLLLRDKNQFGELVGATVDYATASIALDGGTDFSGLSVPVETFGNVIDVTRGESVDAEVLGSGDATLANQFFKLKKGPLTYLNAATSDNEQGVASTLRVYVEGVQWQEVGSFYGTKATDQVYVVRQGDDNETYVHFGDGRYGVRLPSGAANVVAYYRYGAGRAAPPADSIKQQVKAIKGINKVDQVLAAYGGADAESASDLRELAPRSALLLGRAISIDDIQVVAAGVAGVDAALAQWQWQAQRQRPAVQIWYVGDVDSEFLLHKVSQLVSPSVPLNATAVGELPVHLSIDLELDANYLEEQVLNDVFDLLVNPQDGVLLAENTGFQLALVRSQLFSDLLSVPGVLNVDGLMLTVFGYTFAWDQEMIPLPVEFMVDFIAGGIRLNGKEF